MLLGSLHVQLVIREPQMPVLDYLPPLQTVLDSSLWMIACAVGDSPHSISTTKITLHRQAQRPVCQLIRELFKLTIEINHLN